MDLNKYLRLFCAPISKTFTQLGFYLRISWLQIMDNQVKYWFAY